MPQGSILVPALFKLDINITSYSVRRGECNVIWVVFIAVGGRVRGPNVLICLMVDNVIKRVT